MRRFFLFIIVLLFLVGFTEQASAQGSQTVNSGAKTTAIGFPGTGCYYSWVNDTPGIGLAASGAGSIPSFTAVNTGAAPILATITAKPVAPAAYIANAGDSTVSVITTATGKVAATIKLDNAPIGVSVSPDGSRVYVAGGGPPGVISVINTATNTVVAAIQLAGVSNNVLVSPDGTKVYVTTNNELTVISTATNTITASIALASPFGIAVSPNGNTLYVTSQGGNNVFVINTQTDKVTATIPVGSDAVLDAVSPDGSRLYVVNYSSASVSVINTATNLVIATIPVGPDPFGIAVTPDGSMVYVGNAGANNVSAISTTTNTVQSTITFGNGVPAEPYGLCVTPDGTQLYIANANANQVTIINTKTNAVVTTVPVGLGPNSHGNFITGGAGCSSTPVKYTITVNPAASAPPTITAGQITGSISACAGTASTSPNIQQFTVSGANLTGNITATAPPGGGFEVSLSSGSGYGNSVTLPQMSGTIGNTVIYVRSAATAPTGNISGDVTLTAPAAAPQKVPVGGTINPLPTVNTVANQSLSNGAATAATNFTGTGNTFTWVNDTPGIGLPATGSGDIASFNAVNTGTTPITATLTVTPSNAAFAYIPNAFSNNVSVINTSTNSIQATIATGATPTCVSVAPAGDKVYITCRGDNSISVVNTAGNTIAATFQLIAQPYDVVVSPDGKLIYVTCSNASDVSVISTATGLMVNTINISGNPTGLAISPDGGTLYVANTNMNNVLVINTTTNAVIANIPVGADPEFFCLSGDGKFLYVTNGNSNTVSVISTATRVVTATINAGTNPTGIVMSADEQRVYVANQTDGSITVIETAANSAIATIGGLNLPNGLSLTEDGNYLYEANAGSGNVYVFSTTSDQVVSVIQVGANPIALGNFISNGGCSGPAAKFTITVNPAPAIPASITTGLVTGNITACVGTASASPSLQQFTVSGSNLVADITATAQPGFEISLNPEAGFGVTADIAETGGVANNVVVFVRSSPTAVAGVTYGSILLTANGAASQTVNVSSLVSAYPTVNNPGNQTLYAGNVTAGINFTGTGNSFDWKNDTPSIGLAGIGTGNIGSFTAVNTGSAPVTATITVTPKTAGYAYIANGGSNTVSVINTGTNQVVATIPVGNSPYGVAVSPHGDWVYVTNTLDNTVSVIDTKTNKVSYTVPVGTGPTSMSLSPSGSMLYVVNETLNTVSVINTATHTVVQTITTGNNPVCAVVSPDGSRLYVDNQNDQTITVYNTTTNALIYTIPVTHYTPAQMVISADGRTLYVAALDNGGSFLVINTSTYAYVVTGSLSTSSFAHGVALTADGSELYVSNYGSNNISVINTATDKLLATIPVGSNPEGVSITSGGNFVYVANGDGSVSVISTATNQVTANTEVGEGPISIGNFIATDSGCPGAPVSFTITAAPPPSPPINPGPVTGSITACVGAASASPNIQQFTVSGSNLTGNITATAPTGFEVSLNPGSGYGVSVTLPQTGGTVGSTVIYVCSSPTAVPGNISGNVTLTSPGITTQNVAVTGIVNAYLTVNTVPPQTLTSGSATQAVNFTGTGNSYGWVNDTPGIGLPASGTGNIPSFTAVNAGSSPVIATITVTPQHAGVAYISNSISNNVTAINTLTNTVVTTIPVGIAPLGVTVSPDNTRVYVANSNSNTVSVINTATNTVVATIPVGQMPQAVSVSADGSRVYVCNLNNSVSVIASATNTVIATIEGFIAPFALAASTSGNILFVSNASGTVSVVNTTTNTIQQTITLGGNFSDPYQIVVSPDGSQVYVSNFSSNTVSVINTATYSVTNTISVGMGPGGMAISPDGNFIYLSCYYAGNVTVINTNTDAIVQTINVNSPVGISVTADGKNVYVVNNPSSVAQGTPATVSVISTATYSVIATAPVGAGPNSLGNFIAAGVQCSTPGTFTITVNPNNNVTAGPVTGNISACEGTASASPNIQQFTVSTNGLSGNVTATAPTGFELSLSAGSGYSSSITLTQTGGTVVYVRSAATATAGNISGNVTLSAAGVTFPDVLVTGSINALPTVNTVTSQTVNSGTATTAIDFSGTGDSYTWVNDTPGIGLPAAGSGDIASFTAINTGSSPVTAAVTVTPGSDAYAYVPASSSPGTVSVISVATNTLVQTITVGAIPTSISVSPDGSRVYITNSSSNTVSVINTATNTVMATIAVGNDPNAVVVSPDNTRVFVANLNDGTVSVITTASNTVTATINGFQKPRALAISPGGLLYVCNTNDISVINTAADNVEATITGEIAWEIAISPDGSMIYITTIDGSVTVISTATNSVVATIPVAQTPEGLAVSPDGSILYVACFGGGNVTAIDTKTNTIISTISVPGGPITLSVGADGKSLLVQENTSSAVAVINTATGKIIATLPVGTNPIAFGNFVSTGSGCPGMPVSFTITVNPGPLGNIIIPNTFTPNGDGVNDTWDIKHLDSYPQCTVQIFTRWGQNVYSSTGYGSPWNGTYRGETLPSGTYYYVINLNNNTQLLSGFVAIIR